MGLMGMVPLYTGSRLSSQIKADKYSHLAAMEDVRAAERDLRIQVAATYLQLLYNKSELSIVRQQQDVSQLLLKQAQSLYKRGKRPVSDVVEAEALVSRDEAMLAAAEGNVTLAMFDLRQLLNLPDSVRFDVCEPSDTIDTLSPLLELSSLASHPEVLSDKYNIQQAEQQVKVARSCYYPSLMLVGEFGTFWGSFYAKASHRGWLPLLAPWGSLGDFNYHFSVNNICYNVSFLWLFANSLEKTPVLGKIEDSRRGLKKMRWLNSITDSMDRNLSKFYELVEDRGA
jgi:outer membrane protein TolC